MHFFLWKKVATKNRTNAQQIEIICGDVLAQYLNGLAESGQNVTIAPISGYTRENRLSVAVMPELWHGKRQLLQVALLCFAVDVHDARRVFERESAKEKLMNQAKNGGIRTYS